MTEWSRRAVLWGLAGWGCARRSVRPLDPSLPDGEAPEQGTPQEVLVALSAHPSPEPRARALASLVRATPAEALLRWSTQGAYDPDPWVQARVAQALVDRGDPIGWDQLVEAFARRSSDGYAVSAAVHRAMDGSRRLPDDAVDAVWRQQRPWDAAPRALVAWRHGHSGAGAVISAGLASGLFRADDAFLGRLAAYGDPAWANAVRAGAERVEEMATSVEVVLAAWGDRDALRAWRRRVRGGSALAAREAFDPWASLPASLAESWWAVASKSRDLGVGRAAVALRRPRLATLQRALDDSVPYAGEVVWPALASLSPGERRAAIAFALSHPDDRVVEAAAVAVQRHRVAGLEGLLEPLAGHGLASVRAAVAGARVLTQPAGPDPDEERR